jgi:hypothetical protein
MNARAQAIDVLARVEATDAFLNVVLDQRLAEAPPADPRDSGLITELSYGTTRRRLGLDRVITQFSDRKLASLEDRVPARCASGLYQIFHSRIPRRAAVSETVEGLKQLGLRAPRACQRGARKVAGWRRFRCRRSRTWPTISRCEKTITAGWWSAGSAATGVPPPRRCWRRTTSHLR